MNVFIAWDGDHIGRQVERAGINDDVEGLRRISQSIDAGNAVWKSWVESHGGSLISMGGDEGRAEVPADYLDELPKIRVQYGERVGSPVSVGVGTKLSEADKALVAAKHSGGDRVVFFTDEIDELVAKIKSQGNVSEDDKLKEALTKAAPAMNPGAFSGASRPSAPSVEKPVATQGDHEEGQALNAFLGEERPAPPEMTHAAGDFEDEMHQHAAEQEKSDHAQAVASTKNLDDVKQTLVQALQVIKQQAPMMEQVKQTAPDLYAAMMGLTQATVGLARELQTQTPMKKAEQGLHAIHQPHLAGSDGTQHYSMHLPGGEHIGYALHNSTGIKAVPKAGFEHHADAFRAAVPTAMKAEMTADTSRPSEGELEHEDALAKGKLPMPKPTTGHHVVLPSGTQLNGKIKVTHSDGKQSWKQVQSGMIRGQDPSGHPVSSRNPGSK